VRFVLLLLLLCGCAHKPAQSRRLSAVSTALVLLSVDEPRPGHLRVFFRWPDETNTWFAEWSTNLVQWHRAYNETILPGGLRYTEGDAWETKRFWRLVTIHESMSWERSSE